MQPMTKEQSDVVLAQMGARYVQTRDGVEWWMWDAKKMWVGRRVVDRSRNLVELRQAPCSC